MANLNGFNATEVEPTSSFDPLPAGKYMAAITESEMKPTKSGSGSYLQLTFTILEGEFRGRVLWARLNLNNPNATAVKIARSELSAICHATGGMHVSDSEELHLIPMTIQVKIRPPKNGYGAVSYTHRTPPTSDIGKIPGGAGS